MIPRERSSGSGLAVGWAITKDAIRVGDLSRGLVRGMMLTGRRGWGRSAKPAQPARLTPLGFFRASSDL